MLMLFVDEAMLICFVLLQRFSCTTFCAVLHRKMCTSKTQMEYASTDLYKNLKVDANGMKASFI